MAQNIDPYELQRFCDAQRSVYEQVQRELLAGRKQSHWMWFIFPQVKGPGHSAMAWKYAISSIAEGKAYLVHPLLGPRIRDCTQRVTNLNGLSIEEIFGHPDWRKFQSSMTLFANITDDNQVFLAALQKYFGAEQDPQTLERLGSCGC